MSHPPRRTGTAQTLALHPATRAVRQVLALTFAASCIIGLDLSPAQAADANEIVSVRSYNIAAGALSPALSNFAAKAGVSISVETSLLAGLSTRGLHGNFSLQEGFNRLLEGSGLEAVAQGNGNYTVRKIPVNNAVTLPTITASTAVSAVTEGSGSYTTGAMNTATRLSLSLRDTPQSVSVISRQRLDDQNLTSLNDVVKNATGLSTIGNGVGADDTRYHARGFPVDNLMLDGVPISFGFNGAASMPSGDMIMYDRIEVVRGAPGLTVGAGNPSATINMVRKRPTTEPLFNASASVGSWGRYSMSADASRALNESGSLRARVAANWQDKDSFVDIVNTRNQTLYGIMEADLSRDTTLSLGASRQKSDTTGVTMGLPTYQNGTFAPFDRSTFYGAPWSYTNRTGNSTFADLTHQLTNEWIAKVAVVSSRNNSESLYPYWWQNASWTAPFTFNQGFGGRYESNDLNADAYLTGPAELFGRRHEFIIGVSQRRNESSNSSFRPSLNGVGNMSVLDPTGLQNAPLPGLVVPLTPSANTTTQKAIYGAAQLNLTDRLKTIIGGRLNWYDYMDDIAQEGYKLTREFTPYAGATFTLNKQHSLYGSYTQIFQPQSVIGANGKVLDPVTGTNLEAGIKGEYFDGALNASFAVFNIKQQNRPMEDLTGPSPCPSTGAILCNRAAGEVESEGYEMEVSGALMPGWQMSAAYTYVSAKYTKDQVASNVGLNFNTRLPQRQFKLSTSYQLPGALNQWTVGGSVYAQSVTYNKGTTSLIEQKPYAIAGLMLAYKIDQNLRVQLNVDNLFDKKYYEALGYVRAGYGSNNWYGAPRNFMLTLNYKM